MADDSYDDIPTVSPEQAQQMGLQEVGSPAASSGDSTPAPSSDDDIPTVTPEQAQKMGLRPQQESSGAGAFVRGAVEGGGGLAGGLAGFGAGAELGAAVGSAAGPVGAAVGGLAGGIAGGAYGAYKGSELQDWLMDKMGLREGTGNFSRAQEQADIEQHPYMREAGNLMTNAAAFGFDPAAGVGQRLLGAGLFGGFEAGQEAYNEGEFDPTKIAMAAAAGGILTAPRTYAERLETMGRDAARKAIDVVRPVAGPRGIAAENPPPLTPDPQDVGVNIDNKVTRDSGNDGRYQKAPVANDNTSNVGQISADGVTDEQAAALSPSSIEGNADLAQSLNSNSVSSQARPPAASSIETPEPSSADLSGLVLPKEGQPERPAANTGEPAQQDLSDLVSKPATVDTYVHPDPDFSGVVIHRNEDTPHLGITADGRNVNIDSNVPPVIDVGGKSLDPAYPLAVRAVKAHQASELIDEAVRGKEIEAPTPEAKAMASDQAGDLAQKQWLERNGYDYPQYLEAMENVRNDAVPPDIMSEIQSMRGADADVTGTVTPRSEADYGDAAIQQLSAKEKPTQLAQPEQPVGDGVGGSAAQSAQVEPTAPKTTPKTVEAQYPGKKLVDNTVKSLRERGRGADADKLMQLEPKARLQAATKLNAALNNKSGGVRSVNNQMVPRIRNPEVRGKLQVDDLGVEAKTAADAAKKTKAIEALKGNGADKRGVFETHAPTGEETDAQLRARLKSALDAAKEANDGADPVKTYKPTDAPREWYWAHDAAEVLRGRRSMKQFRADEQLLRGSDEDFNAFKRDRLDENNRRFNKRTGDVVVAGQQAESAKRFDEAAAQAAEASGTKSPLVDPDEPGLPERSQQIAKVDEAVSSAEKTTDTLRSNFDNQVRVDNNPKQAQKLEGQKYETEAEQRRVKMAAQRAARLAKSNTKEVQEQKVTPPKPEVPEAAKADVTKAAKTVEATGKDEAVVPEASKLGEFFDNEKGALNAEKVVNVFRAQRDAVKGALEKYFGMPFSDVARNFANRVAQSISHKNQLEASMQRMLDARWELWKKVGQKNTFAYLKALETMSPSSKGAFVKELVQRGIDLKDANWMADEAQFHRELMDQVFKDDEAHGSKAEYIQNYVPHIFTGKKINGLSAEQWIEQYIKTLGANWYQKSRTFATLEAAMQHGFELKFDNPIDMIHARMAASINSNMLVATLRNLQRDGLAYPVKEAPKGPKATWTNKFVLPDGQQWVIHPEGAYIWHNAMVARGLSQANNVWGSVYRSWMKFKNIWAPIELMGSAFHEVHIAANINVAANLSRAIKLTAADPKNALKYFGNAAKWSLTDPLFALPLDKIGGGIGDALDNLSGNKFSEFRGRQMQNWWEVDPKYMTPQQKVWSDLFKEAGVSPNQAAEEVIGARRALSRAIAKGDYLGAGFPAMRRAIELSQAWMFKYQIPALKNVALMRNMEAAFQMDPSLASNNIKRMAVMRELGKNIDARYGEMFYKNLFWNRYLKDSGIASFLSLSWNYGQFNQAAGALNNLGVALRDMAGMSKNKDFLSRRQREVYKASDRGTFVASYVGISMASAGLLSYALSGQIPSGLDWFFPRTGVNNPDGRPGRLTTPFNTREPFMLAGHIDEHGGGLSGAIGGLGHFLYNKMIISPLVEAFENRDFFGRKLFDRDAPFYKGALQLADSVLGSHFDPIGHTSAQRAEQLGYGAKGKALAYAGFGPAPKYIQNTSMENKINSHFNEEGTAYSHPYEYGEKTGLGRGMVQDALRGQGAVGSALAKVGLATPDKLKSEARIEHRAEINAGIQTGDKALERQGRLGMATEGGMSPRLAAHLRPNEEFQWKYSRLPIETKLSLAKEMTPQQFRQYVYFNRVSKKDRAEIVKANPQLNAKAVGQPAVNASLLPSR